MKVCFWRRESLGLDDEDFEDEDDEDESDEEDDMSKLRRHIIANTIKIPVTINTHFGSVSSSDVDNILFEKEIFSCHCNFYIDASLAVKLMQVKGVDGLRILSPYSFAICVGMCFFFGDVLNDIEEVLEVENPEDFDDDFREISDEETSKILDEHGEIVKLATEGLIGTERWLVYILPNGKFIRESFETDEEMDERCEFFMEMCHLSSGLLLSSNDELE